MTRRYRPKLAFVLTLAAMAIVPATAQAMRTGPFVTPSALPSTQQGGIGVFTTPSAPPSTQQGAHSGAASCSEACSGGGYTTAAHTGEPGVPPTLGVLQASKLAAVNRAEAQQAQARHLRPTAGYSNAEINAYASTVHPAAAVTPANTTPSDAFDWTDAVIGAGIATTIALLLMVTSVAVRRRSQIHHT
jgi:hypothetical protein